MLTYTGIISHSNEHFNRDTMNLLKSIKNKDAKNSVVPTNI